MSRHLPILLFILGLLVLVPAVVLFTDQGPFERTPAGSQAVYWQDALATHADGAPGTPPSQTQSPYVMLLAPLASGELGAVHRARMIQAAFFLVIFAAAAFVLGRRRIGSWAVAGGLATVLLGPLVISAHNFSPALPAAAVLLAALIVLDRRPHWAFWAAAGVLVGLAGRFFSLLAWSLALLLLFRAVTVGSPWQRIRTGGIFLAAAAVASFLTGLPSPSQPLFPTVPGIDVYRGHREGSSGVSPRRGDGDLQGWWSFADYAREASRVRVRALTPREADAYWRGKVPGEIARDPFAEARRSGTKLLATYQGDPLPHEVGASFLRDRSESRALDVLVWAGRLLIPIGLWGLIWRRKQAGWVLMVAALSGLAASMITFASPFGRLVTLVACGAGVGFWLQAMVRGPSRWKGAAGALIVLGLWGALPLHGGVPGLGIQGDDYFYLGTVYDREQRGSAAIREYERSIRLDPANPYPHLAIAAMLARDNVNEEALRQLEQLRTRYPDYPPVLFALVHLYQAQQQWLDAANVYGRLISIEPWNPEHWNNLGTIYVQVGFYDQAARALDSALRLDPDYQSAIENRALLRSWGIFGSGDAGPARENPFDRTQEAILELVKTEKYEAAADSLEAAYAAYGRDRVELQFLEGTLKLLSGDSEDAISVYESLRNRMPDSVTLLFNLAAAYQKLNRLEEAKATYEEARRLQPTNERVRRGLAEVEAALDSLKKSP